MKIVLTIAGALFVSFFVFTALSGRTSPPEETYKIPVLVQRFTISRNSPDHYSGILGIGDPSVVFHGGRYYLYPTGDNYSYDVYISPDLVTWEKGPKVFTSEKGTVWAPDVFYSDEDSRFYLYYTAQRQIGVAVSDRPDGRFEDRGILIPGAIDAHLFNDEGKLYLYYASYPGLRLYVQPMADPLTTEGSPVRIIAPSEPWERSPYPLTEAPWMLKHDGTYYLLYSGGGADTEDYAIGYATSKSPLGPFKKYPVNPIIRKGDGVFGPGHASVTEDLSGMLWLVYHQQRDNSRGWDRIITIDRLWFDDRGILHGKATRGVPQPRPVTGERFNDT
jgi:beta-xylosidase